MKLVRLDFSRLYEENKSGFVAFRKNFALLLEKFALLIAAQIREVERSLCVSEERFKSSRRLMIFAGSHFVFLQSGFNGVQKFRIIEGLGQIIIGPQLHPLSDICFLGFGRKKNEWHVSPFGLFGEDV